MKKFRNIALIGFFLIVPTIWITFNVLYSVKVECKVCMSFQGAHNCGKAVASDKASCVSTAQDNACALIASGMASSIQCSQKDPDLVEVK